MHPAGFFLSMIYPGLTGDRVWAVFSILLATRDPGAGLLGIRIRVNACNFSISGTGECRGIRRRGGTGCGPFWDPDSVNASISPPGGLVNAGASGAGEEPGAVEFLNFVPWKNPVLGNESPPLAPPTPHRGTGALR